MGSGTHQTWIWILTLFLAVWPWVSRLTSLNLGPVKWTSTLRRGLELMYIKHFAGLVWSPPSGEHYFCFDCPWNFSPCHHYLRGLWSSQASTMGRLGPWGSTSRKAEGRVGSGERGRQGWTGEGPTCWPISKRWRFCPSWWSWPQVPNL